MPLRWKKGKSSKISKLFNDHLDTQRLRGGGSIVVETGFPTSVVDLLVKNSKRFKKFSKMRKTKSDSSILEESPLPLDSSPPVPRSSPLPSTLLNNSVEETDEAVGKEVKEDENFRGILMAVLRMFFVVVLALGTKKFAVGLTMSAFFLFFVEYVGIYLYRFLMPCSEAKKRLRLMIWRIPNILRLSEEKPEGENGGLKEPMGVQEEISENCGCSVLQDHKLISPVCEVKVIQPKRFLVPFLEDIQCLEEEESGRFGFDGDLTPQGSESNVVVLEKEEEFRCEVLEFKKTNSRAKIKTKIKHIFRRKSRSKKKGEQNLDDEISPIGRKILMSEEEDDRHRNERELKCSSDLSYISIGSYEGEEAIDDIYNSGELQEEEGVDEVVIREEEEIQKKGNSGYLFICLIILIGLLGGRISALMLILSWCFIEKSAGKLRRCLTWPVIRCFCPDVIFEYFE